MSKKFLRGYVVSNKMIKTIVVSVTRLVKHKIYNKFLKKTTKVHVHINKSNICNINDLVEIKESKPYSKTKFWVFTKIIKKSIYN